MALSLVMKLQPAFFLIHSGIDLNPETTIGLFGFFVTDTTNEKVSFMGFEKKEYVNDID
jgi:hypothetical protein